ncbi:MAG: LTA synthase family protein [bacterium]
MIDFGRYFKKITIRKKLFAVISISFFLLKLNYLLLEIINVPSLSGVILKNLVIITISVLIIPEMIKTKRGRILIYVVSIVFSFLFMANYWYNIYFGDYLSVHDMILSEGTGSFSFITVLTRHIIKPYDFFFILDIFLLGLLIPEKKTSPEDKTSKELFKASNTIYKNSKYNSNMIILIIILILFVSQISFVNYRIGNTTPIEIYKENTTEFVNIYGIIPLYLMETYELLSPALFYTANADTTDSGITTDSNTNIDSGISNESDITPGYDINTNSNISSDSSINTDSNIIQDSGTHSNKSNNNQVDILDTKPNIIVIQMESFDARLIDHEYRGKEITPFLNNLSKESIYFTNFYAQHVNGSFDSDFSFLTSLYPVNRNYTFRENNFSRVPTLAKELKRNGYQNYAFHGYIKEFFSRDKAFPDLGFDKFYSLEDYSLDETVMKVENQKLGLNDYDFFRQSLSLLEAEVKNNQKPFFAYFITLTSHTPFHFYPENQTQEEYSEMENTFVRDYFNSISFLDKSLQLFFNGLEEKGMTENTLFVIYGDHQAGIDSNTYSNQNFSLNDNVKPPEAVPLILHHSKLKSSKINSAGSFADIAPTILDIIGAEEIPDTFLGRSLISDNEKPIPFLHENPLVLYNDNLFLIQRNNFKKIGYIDGTNNTDIQLSESQKKYVYETIDKTRSIIFNTREY